jgi:hypothetical protein
MGIGSRSSDKSRELIQVGDEASYFGVAGFLVGRAKNRRRMNGSHDE